MRKYRYEDDEDEIQPFRICLYGLGAFVFLSGLFYFLRMSPSNDKSLYASGRGHLVKADKTAPYKLNNPDLPEFCPEDHIFRTQKFCYEPCELITDIEDYQFSKDKVLRITGHTNDGFWVRALMVVTQVEWGLLHGMRNYYVRSNSKIDPYWSQNKYDSAWDEYFEPLDPKSRMVDESNVVELSCDATWDVWAKYINLYIDKWKPCVCSRYKRSPFIASLIHPQQSIVKMVDKFWKEAVKPGNLVLGVHIRGTDKVFGGRVVEPTEYYDLVEDYIAYAKKQGKGVQIFLASDDAGYIKTFKNAYNKYIITQPGDILRGVRGSENQVNPWKTSKGDPHKKGLQVMFDTIALSKTDYLLKTHSAVSDFSIFWNPKLNLNSYDYNMKDPRKPSWARDGSDEITDIESFCSEEADDEEDGEDEEDE